MPVEVEVTHAALEELASLPLPIQQRVVRVFERLGNWPQISGAKPLSGRLKGNWRIRTGNYRVVFRVDTAGELIVVWKIGYRGDVYD